MQLGRLVPLCLLFALSSPSLSAQTERNNWFYELLQQHLDSMSRDTLVQRLSKRPEGLSIADVLPPDMYLRLSDTNLVRLASVLTISLGQVDRATCANFPPIGTTPDLVSLATRVDTATARKWLRVFHQIMLTGLLNLPRGRLATPDSAARAVAKGSLVEDPCVVTQNTYRKLMAMSPQQAGPLLRRLFAPDTTR